jgi:hypothetical protein
MAIISISIGGKPVPIEVPDFAMESTQQQILNNATQMNAALASLSGLEQRDNVNNARLIRTVQDSAKTKSAETKEDNDKLRRSLTGAMSGAVEKGIGLVGQNTGADLSKKIFETIGMAKLGQQFGMAFGFMEALGSTMAKTARVGVNFGDDLIEVQGQAAQVGLTLDQFGKMVGTSGLSMRALGNTTQDGSRAFLSMNRALLDTLAPFGNFGMKTDEMSMMLADEIETRRKIVGIDGVRNLTQGELTESMKEQIRLGQVQARLTGEDIQAARARNLEARQNAINASYLSEQSAATAERFGKMAEILGRTPGGREIADSITSALATNGDPRQFQATLIGMMGVGGIVDELMQLVPNDGIGLEEFTERVTVMTSDLTKNAIFNGEEMRRLAVVSDNTAARTILETRTEAVSIGINDFRASVAAVDAQVNSSTTSLLGLSTKVSIASANLETTLATFIANMAGGDIGNAAQTFSNLAEKFSTLASDEQFLKTVSTAGSVFGNTAIQPFNRAIQFLAGTSDNVNITDLGYLLSIPLRASGVEKAVGVADALQSATNATALVEGLDALTQQAADVLGEGADPFARAIERFSNIVESGNNITREEYNSMGNMISELFTRILEAQQG